jgi:hypothetical protein
MHKGEKKVDLKIGAVRRVANGDYRQRTLTVVVIEEDYP